VALLSPAVDTHGGGTGGPRSLPAQVRFAILQSQHLRCRYCGRRGNAPGVVLHVVPHAAGGATREDNLRTACEECNSAGHSAVGEGGAQIARADASVPADPANADPRRPTRPVVTSENAASASVPVGDCPPLRCDGRGDHLPNLPELLRIADSLTVNAVLVA